MMSMTALQLEAAMKAYTDSRAKNGSPIGIYMALSMPVGAIRRPVSCTSEATQGGRASIVRVVDVSTLSVAYAANRGDSLNIANKDIIAFPSIPNRWEYFCMNTSKKLTQLVIDVEELLAALSNEHSPEVKELRDQVEDAIASAKHAIATQGKSATARLAHYAGSVDDYITQYPRLAFATGALIGSVIGYVAGLTSSKE